MSTSKEKAGALQSYGDRGGVHEHDVQHGPTSVGRTDESVRADDGTSRGDPDWEHAYKHLSALLGRQFIGGDCLVLIAMDIRHNLGDEEAFVFADHVGLNRPKSIHKFMG
jgi:hypothetical protein